MNKFTVKDFIAYNNPCFSCGELISLRVGTVPTNASSGRAKKKKISWITPVVSPETVDIDLRITYSTALKLQIAHKTNKFQSNDPGRLLTFLTKNHVCLSIECDCLTRVTSQWLEFDIRRGHIRAFEISNELVVVRDSRNMYILDSFFDDNQSIIVVTTNKLDGSEPTRIELPLMPLYKFTDRKHFINKMRTYLTFS